MDNGEIAGAEAYTSGGKVILLTLYQRGFYGF